MIEHKPLVMIAILNWNGLADTLDCLSSVYKTQDVNFRVIVIDNNSLNDELSIIKLQFPEIISYQSQVNLGFTGGCNLGIDYAIKNGAQYIWLLNNDAVVYPNTLASLVDKMQKDTKIGMISPIIYDRCNQHLWFCGTSIDHETLSEKLFQSPEEYRIYQSKSPDDIGLWGTALLLRTVMVEQVGFMDDRYFAYAEDKDYSIRANTCGWKNSVDTDVKILHGTKVSKREIHISYYRTRNNYLLLAKHSTKTNKLRNIRKYISRIIKQAAELEHKGDVELSIILLGGLWDAINNYYGVWNRQRKMPPILTRLILSHPYFLSSVIKLGLS